MKLTLPVLLVLILNSASAQLSFNRTSDAFISYNDSIPMPFNTNHVGRTLMNFEPLVKHPESVPFRMSTSSTNFGPWQEDNVLMFGWNLGSGGAAIVPGQPGIGYSMEQNYKPSADGSLTESHEFWITPKGRQVRLKSYTINNTTEDVDFYHTISRMYYKSPQDGGIWGGVYQSPNGVVYNSFTAQGYQYRWNYSNGGAVFESPANLPVQMNGMAYFALPGMVALQNYTSFRVPAYFDNIAILRSSADIAGNLTNKGYNLLSEILALKARVEQLEAQLKQ